MPTLQFLRLDQCGTLFTWSSSWSLPWWGYSQVQSVMLGISALLYHTFPAQYTKKRGVHGAVCTRTKSHSNTKINTYIYIINISVQSHLKHPRGLTVSERASRWWWIRRGDSWNNTQLGHKLGADNPRLSRAGEGVWRLKTQNTLWPQVLHWRHAQVASEGVFKFSQMEHWSSKYVWCCTVLFSHCLKQTCLMQLQ